MRIFNKKARFNYDVEAGSHTEAGISLSGGEAKSVREKHADISDSQIRILSEEAFLINANIPMYNQASDKEYDAQKSRKLLLHRHQIDSLIGKTSGKNTTLIPLSIYEKNNRFKVEVGLARSKKEFDHRKAIKEQDHARRVEQELRGKA